jgi:ribose 5-phosphate isomerase A
MATDPTENLAEQALSYVKEGSRVGLGTGRAATAFIKALSRRVQGGLTIQGVATSLESERLARAGGISLTSLGAGNPLDVAIDGADEVDPRLDLIKGYGGALVREKIVAAASRSRVILVTPEKLVRALGERGKLPVEVIPFASALVQERLIDLGFRAAVRTAGAEPFLSDNGNWILDVVLGPIADPPALERTIREIPGVVGTGLFLGLADVVLVGRPDGGIDVLRRPERAR